MTDRPPSGPARAEGGPRFADLAAVAGGGALLAVVVVWADGLVSARASLAAAVLVLPLVAVFPGYALLACLTPPGRAAPRPALTVPVASLALTTLLSLGLWVAPLPGSTAALGVALAVTTVALTALAAVRRRNGAVGPPVEWSTGALSGADTDDVPVAFLAVTGLVLAASVAYVGFAAPPPETFTSVSVQSAAEDGRLDTLELDPGEEATFVVGIENREREPVDYTLVAQVEVVSARGDEATVLGRQSSERFETRLAHGQQWRRNYTVSPEPVPGRQRLVFYLYRGEAPATPNETSAYRTAVVWETVATPSG